MARVRHTGAELRRRQQAGRAAIEEAMSRIAAGLQSSPFARGALQGASLSGADELYGLLGGDREGMVAANQAAEQKSPFGYGAGKFAGEAASLLIPGGALFQGMRRMPLLAKMAGGSTAGSAIEGARGYLEGEDPSERARLAQEYATIGGAVGGAIPALGPGYRAAKRGGSALMRSRFAQDTAGSADLDNLSRRQFLKKAGAVGAAAAAGAMVPGGVKMAAKALGKTGAKTAARAASIKFGVLHKLNPNLAYGMGTDIVEAINDDVLERMARERGLGPDDDAYHELMDELADDVDLNSDDLVAFAEPYIDDIESLRGYAGRPGGEQYAQAVDEARGYAKTLLDEAEKLEGANLDEIGELRARAAGTFQDAGMQSRVAHDLKPRQVARGRELLREFDAHHTLDFPDAASRQVAMDAWYDRMEEAGLGDIPLNRLRELIGG